MTNSVTSLVDCLKYLHMFGETLDRAQRKAPRSQLGSPRQSGSKSEFITLKKVCL